MMAMAAKMTTWTAIRPLERCQDLRTLPIWTTMPVRALVRTIRLPTHATVSIEEDNPMRAVGAS
jgi:hypothetical protein